TYGDDGNYTIRVTVNDAGGATGSATTSIQVNDVAPTATITGAPTSSITEGTAVNLTGSATSPGAYDTAHGFSFAWTVTRTGFTGNWDTGTGSSFSFTPNHSGTYTVTLTATDSDGGTVGSTTKTITVTNVAPTPALSGPAAGVPGQALSYTGTF